MARSEASPQTSNFYIFWREASLRAFSFNILVALAKGVKFFYFFKLLELEWKTVIARNPRVTTLFRSASSPFFFTKGHLGLSTFFRSAVRANVRIHWAGTFFMFSRKFTFSSFFDSWRMLSALSPVVVRFKGVSCTSAFGSYFAFDFDRKATLKKFVLAWKEDFFFSKQKYSSAIFDVELPGRWCDPVLKTVVPLFESIEETDFQAGSSSSLIHHFNFPMI